MQNGLIDKIGGIYEIKLFKGENWEEVGFVGEIISLVICPIYLATTSQIENLNNRNRVYFGKVDNFESEKAANSYEYYQK